MFFTKAYWAINEAELNINLCKIHGKILHFTELTLDSDAILWKYLKCFRIHDTIVQDEFGNIHSILLQENRDTWTWSSGKPNSCHREDWDIGNSLFPVVWKSYYFLVREYYNGKWPIVIHSSKKDTGEPIVIPSSQLRDRFNPEAEVNAPWSEIPNCTESIILKAPIIKPIETPKPTFSTNYFIWWAILLIIFIIVWAYTLYQKKSTWK